MWSKLGRALGKGILWLVRNPEAVAGIVEVISQKRQAPPSRPPAPENSSQS